MFESQTEQLLVTLENRVATITMNRPATKNALTDEMREALVGAIEWAAGSDEVGAIVLTGAGQGFCSGADVSSLGGATESTIDTRYKTLVRSPQGDERCAGRYR